MLEVSVLGPLEVLRDGEPVAIPGGKTAELLVRLAVEPGVLVRADRIVEDLWAAPVRANTLQAKVARLRRALGHDAVETGDGGYRLAGAVVDAATVLEAAAAGDAERASAALARFRGDVLPTAGDWAAPHRTRLEDARTQLQETRLAARMRLGEDVVAELEAAVAADPYRERWWELLMTALYHAGRPADALAAYQRARARLDEDLGLAPGPALRGLEQQVLEHDAALRPRLGNLPSLAVALIGRDAELARLTASADRLTTVVGPGGIGKTALAIAAGRTLDVPVWLVRLEAATTPDEVLDAVVATLGASGEAALVERLRAREQVLVLDNCEHVVDAAAALAARLLDAAPALRVLATSQVALGLDGEAVLELRPLAHADAVALFTRRAARPVGAVDRLCRALDGLPLAIELAAARTKTLSTDEISRRLDDRFSVLSDPASRKPERRRALRATIAWSYELLFPDDRRGLHALAVFAGDAPLAAVEAVLTALGVPSAAAIDVLGRLAARSLVIAEDDRYRLLDSIRAFALDVAGPDRDRAHAAHAAWYAGAACLSTAGVRSADQAGFLDQARAERANLDAALAWCARHDPEQGLAIANGFAWAWIVLGDSRGAQRLLSALAAAPDAPARDRAEALLSAGWIEASTGRLDQARARIAAVDHPSLRGRADCYLAYVVSHDGDWEQGTRLTARAAARLEDPWDQAANALFASRAAISAGDRDRARAAAADVERTVAAVDDPWLEVRAEAMRGELARLEHRFDDAVAHIGRAAEASGRRGFQQTEAYQLSSLGRAQCQAGDYEAGAATLERSIAKAEATGDVRMAALARVHLGRVLRALGRDARPALEAAAAWHDHAGGGEQAALGATLLAALDDDEPRLAALLAAHPDDAPVQVFALDALARLRADPALHARADALMPAAAHFITQRDRTDADGARRTPAARP